MKKYLASIFIALFLGLAAGTFASPNAAVFAATVDDRKKDDKKKDPPGPPPVKDKREEPKNDNQKPKDKKPGN
ncbi:MAG: hypothetical protein HY231_20605 [Acidobacteria bacterium]|nr:hypothetical protein [Acidobacteriota bacterium]